MNQFEFIDYQSDTYLLAEPKRKKPRTSKKFNQTNEQTSTLTNLERFSPSFAYNSIQNYGFDTAASAFFAPMDTNPNVSVDMYSQLSSQAKSAAVIEKNRMMSINKAFEMVRLNIPTFPYERRLSKIDTLHLAISYISLLQAVLDSNMNLYDYLKTVLSSSFSMQARPSWASSDLIVRLNWLNWSAVGVVENETEKFLNLFQMFGEATRDKSF